MNGPTLETERLILRPPIRADLEPWSEFMADEEAAKHLGGVVSRSVAWRALCSVAGAWALEGFAMFSVLERSSGEWVGRLGPWMPADWPGTEVGWGIARSRWGRGYATEGSRAAIDWAFDHLGWKEVIHCIPKENVASQRVAESLGSRLRGPGTLPRPQGQMPVEIWGQTREEWKTRRK